MASRNYYYVILGVASNESVQGIRAAFRDLAKRYHPDRVGPAGAAPFREVVEAYETLADPARRNDYDEFASRRSSSAAPAQPLRPPVRPKAGPKGPLLEGRTGFAFAEEGPLRAARGDAGA